MLYKIDPDKVTNFNRTDKELEAFLLFAILVAGKTANVQSQKLYSFLLNNCITPEESPFEIIKRLISTGAFASAIRAEKLGQYRKLETCLPQLMDSNINLRTCDVVELEKIPFIKMKTSRFFLLHSRENAQYAALDVHILRYLREKLHINAPKNTPSSKQQYLELESKFLEHCQVNNFSPSDFDLAIWVAGSRKEF